MSADTDTIQPRACQDCGASMAGRRAHARFCSRRCQLRHLRSHGASGYASGDRGGAVARVGTGVPPATVDTIDELAAAQGVARTDWLRLAIGDRIETDTRPETP